MSTKEERGARLREARKRLKLSATVVGQRAGYSASGIRAMENGQNDVSIKGAEALASVLRTTPEWILTGAGDQPRFVPIVGFVGAGAEAHFYASGQGPFGEAPAPEDATDKTVAAEIKGPSIGRYFDNWLLYYDDVRSPVTEDQLHELCVVGLPDDKVLVKWLKPGADGRFHLLSENEPPIFDQEVIWAARVTGLKPRS